MADLRTALETSLAENPDDLASHMAFADHLADLDDPRGEFIQVQLALEDPSCQGEQRKQLVQRERILLAHEREWLGELADLLIEKDVEPYRQQHGLVNQWKWARGWLDEARLWLTNVARVRTLVRAPAARLLRRLNLGEVGYDGEYKPEPGDEPVESEEYPCLYLLRRASFLPHLRSLSLGEDVDLREDYLNCRSSGEGLTELVAATQRLEELLIYANSVDLAGLFALSNLTQLQTLHLFHMREPPPLDVLADNPTFAALKTLRIRPAHCYDQEGYLPLQTVLPLFTSPHLASLEHLHLHASSMGDRGCEEIVRSGILKQLKTLDLKFGCITDAGARILAACPDIRNLRYLSIENNQLTAAGCELLLALELPTFEFDGQAAVGSDDYLMTGDME